MTEKKYWQGFGEFNDPENFQKLSKDEFREELPFADTNEKGWLDAPAPRRDFLKYLGFSTAAATLAASCKIPVRKAIPYANKPENLIPGEAKYYATTYVQGGDITPVLAKVRDGRPIKLEAHKLPGSSFASGGTSARVQASVLDLYDMYRCRFPSRKAAEGKFEEIPTFEQLDKMLADELAGLNGLPVVLLTGTIVSPTTRQIISEFLSKYPGSRHVQYDAVSYSGMLLANEATGFGRKIPSYRFDQAKIIVSLGADFLGTWLSPVEFTHQYAKGRKIDEKNPSMSRHYQFESFLSMTGGSADRRFTHRPSETGAVALALYAALGGAVSVPSLDEKLKAGIDQVAAELKAGNGNALVVSGSNDFNVQIIVNAINNLVGAYGKTIDWSTPVNYRQGIDKDMAELVEQMNNGQTGALLVYDANPAYTFPDAEKIRSAFSKVKLSVSFSEKMDETTQLCTYSVPAHHFLESWGDAEPKNGCTCFIQPTIYPLFKTRSFQTSLLKWAGNTTDYETYFRNFWTTKLGSPEAFNAVLQSGIKEDAAAVPSAGTFNASPVNIAASFLTAAKTAGKDELVLYQKVSIGTGAQAGNPWLQELPDPISKAAWGNYALISMAKAKELGIEMNVDYEYYPEKPVIKITAGKNELELPVLVIPGMNAHTIAVAVGYGRSGKLGKAAEGIGKNSFPFTSFNGNTIEYHVADIAVKDAGKKEKIAQSQMHNTYEDRFEVVRETTLATFKKEPETLPHYREKLAEDFAKKTGDFRSEATLYPMHDQPGIKWGMSIDLNSCTACGACVVACNAENNIPVVGKNEVIRAHEMNWLRIDRYFVSDKNNPDDLKGVVFQPMLCQHCDNAPCENVCPVSATNHSSEGVNMMIYNRCIGTRYCANNCPYKVRRFNWADYNGADSFPDNQDQTIIGKLDGVVMQMNDDLTRMVLNPDVTVRSRGVMEKCTFCYQRLQAAKLEAKKSDSVLKDGDAVTACMDACPAEAIVFGNLHDKESRVSRMRDENKQRVFYVIEQLHTLPNINYLARVRNTDEVVISHKEAEH